MYFVWIYGQSEPEDSSLRARQAPAFDPAAPFPTVQWLLTDWHWASIAARLQRLTAWCQHRYCALMLSRMSRVPPNIPSCKITFGPDFNTPTPTNAQKTQRQRPTTMMPHSTIHSIPVLPFKPAVVAGLPTAPHPSAALPVVMIDVPLEDQPDRQVSPERSSEAHQHVQHDPPSEASTIPLPISLPPGSVNDTLHTAAPTTAPLDAVAHLQTDQDPDANSNPVLITDMVNLVK